MTKKLLLATLLIFGCIQVLAQGVRYPGPQVTTIQSNGFGAYPFVLAVTNAQISVCNHPANAVPCTNFAPTYTSLTLVTQCPSGTQVVLDGSASCTGTADGQGNWGIFVAPGIYDYTISIQGTSYGPFIITPSVVGVGSGAVLLNPPGNQTITGFPLTDLSGFIGPLTGNVTGNLSGNVTGGTISGVVTATQAGGNVIITNPSTPQTITGQPLTLSTTAPLKAANINNIVMCDQMSGATADAKIAACYASLPSGGIADARGIVGAQSWITQLSPPSNTQLLLAPAQSVTFTVTNAVARFAILMSGVHDVAIRGGNFQLSGAKTDNGGLGGIGTNGTNSNIEVSDMSVTGDTAPPQKFTINSIQRATNIITVNYTGNAGLVVGQWVSIIGVTSDLTMNVELPVASQGAGTFTLANTGSNTGPFAQGTFSFLPKYQITSVQRAANVVTVNYTGNLGLSVNQQIITQAISGDATLNTSAIITSQGAGTFTFAQAGANSGPFTNQGNFMVANLQYGIDLTGILTNAKILRNNVQNIAGLAIACGSSGSDNINGCVIEDNYIYNIPLGNTISLGYGILAQTSSLGGYRIVHNFIDCVGRHSIYTGQGVGHIIADNYIYRNGCEAPAGGEALEIGRQSDATVMGNIISNSYSGGALIFSGTTPGSNGQQFMRNVVFTGNVFVNTQPLNFVTGQSFHDIAVTAENSAVDVPHGTIISNNISRRANAGSFSSMISLGYGIDTKIVDNMCSYDNVLVNGATGTCLLIQGNGETAGTANFSDKLEIYNNHFRTSGGGGSGIYIVNTAGASGINMRFCNNTVEQSPFFSGGQTDTNITFCSTIVAQGTTALTTALIGAGSCGTTVTTAAVGALTTDTIAWSRNAAVAISSGVVTVNAWTTAGNVNFAYCNPTTASVTPPATTVNWQVQRFTF